MREWWWKDAEILILRHQLAVAERERPGGHSRLTWPDRALLTLLAGTQPIGRLAATRLIVIPSTIEHAVQACVVQQARNPVMDLEDAGTRVKFVLHDRDAGLTAAFDAVFRAAGVRVIRSAVQAPRMNAVMERGIGNCRREQLDRTWSGISGV